MSYTLPSVLVYEQLANAGGVANVVPDLPACVIGPAFNVLVYDSSSTASLIQTTATSAVTAVGSMTSGSAVVTFTTQSPFFVGDTLLVPGASASGSTLQGTVLSVSGYTVTLNTTAGTSVSNATVTKTGVIADNQVQNSFNLPNQLPGQKIDTTSIQVYLNNAYVETLATQFNGSSGNNVIVMNPATSTGAATASSDQITGVTNAYEFTIGDPVSVSGAGAAGATLNSVITEIVGTTLTLRDMAATTNASATITKTAVSNVNPTTSTLRMEAGDKVVLSYTNTASVAKTFTTSVVNVVNLTGTIEDVTLADVLPADLSQVTTLGSAVAANATSITVASATGFSAGDQVIIAGAGAGGSDLYTTIGAVATNTFSGLNPAIVTGVGTSATVTRIAPFTLRTRKLYNNQLLQQTLNSYQNYNTSATATTGVVIIEPAPELAYGTVITANVNIAYSALRTDLSGAIQAITTTGDLTGILGTVSDANPLALGVDLAMANAPASTIYAIAVPSNDLVGYQTALELAEGMRLYALVPLTQDIGILTLFQQHVDQLSTPQMALWRMALVNTAIPTIQDIGQYNANMVNSNSGNNTITLVSGKYVLTASNATFMSDGVVAGDIVNITAGTGTPAVAGTTVQVLNVISNQQLQVQAMGTAVAVSYYITRNLTKTQQAAAVAAQSTAFTDKRMVHVQPDLVGITVNGTVKYLPGYYMACCIAGLIAGLPAQQGFTNIAPAGLESLSHGNFYFTRTQYDSMAAAGTCLLTQDVQSSSPYIRHELTTDMSVLQYREIQQVKNIDFLAYFFHDILKSFIGKWNIVQDSIQAVKMSINAGGSLLMGQKLPKIGAPLTSYKIASLAQDKTNLDNLDCTLQVTIPTVMNYINIYLTI